MDGSHDLLCAVIYKDRYAICRLDSNGQSRSACNDGIGVLGSAGCFQPCYMVAMCLTGKTEILHTDEVSINGYAFFFKVQGLPDRESLETR